MKLARLEAQSKEMNQYTQQVLEKLEKQMLEYIQRESGHTAAKE